MTARLTAQMATVLARLPGWPADRGGRSSILGRGLNNRTLRVQFGSEDLVVRQSLSQGPALKLSWYQEFALLEAVAGAGLAPPLRLADPTVGVCISEYLPGIEPWRPEMLTEPKNIERLAARLEALHNIKFDLPHFQPVEVAATYLAAAPQALAGYRDELETLAGDFQNSYPARVLCHNDLVAGNILDNGCLWLIDFEYGVSSDPIVDLAGAAALNGLGKQGRQRLLAAYYGSHAPDPEQFEWVCRFVLLLALAWGHALGLDQSRGDGVGFLTRLVSLLRLFPKRL